MSKNGCYAAGWVSCAHMCNGVSSRAERSVWGWGSWILSGLGNPLKIRGTPWTQIKRWPWKRAAGEWNWRQVCECPILLQLLLLSCVHVFKGWRNWIYLSPLLFRCSEGSGFIFCPWSEWLLQASAILGIQAAAEAGSFGSQKGSFAFLKREWWIHSE